VIRRPYSLRLGISPIRGRVSTAAGTELIQIVGVNAVHREQ